MQPDFGQQSTSIRFSSNFCEEKGCCGRLEVIHSASGKLSLQAFQRDKDLHEAMFLPTTKNISLISRKDTQL